MEPLPRYDDLPLDADGGRSAWGLLGDGQLGRVALLTPELAREATALVRRGVSFPLDLPIGAIEPPLNPRRDPARHTVIRQATVGFDDAWDRVFPQAGSQWDSLLHVGTEMGTYFDGVTAAQVESGEREGVAAWNRHGITGRAVLLDLAAVRADRGEYRPDLRETFGVDELEAARTRAGIEYRLGDILLLHTGFTAWYFAQTADTRAGLPGHVQCAGLDPTEEVCRYLWDSGAAAIAADNFAVEAWPADFSLAAQPWGFIHQVLIGRLGFALGELWWLDDLVRDCRADGVYEGMLVSVPWNARGGVGSPANAVVLK